MSSPSANTLPVTEGLARLGASFCYETLPDDVRFLARQCLLDWLGVTLAGSQEPLARILLDELTEEGGHPRATIVGTRRKATLQQAALINGSASHALDFDDVHTAMPGHPSVPVIPAVLALGEDRAASGRAFIAAFVAGFETECRLGLLVAPGHYATGWHATGTLGTFGAAAACASLLRLNEGEWRNALGIAASQAAGLKSMFGTMCKPLHAGKAAANGLLAAKLAARGFTSNIEAIETVQGFAATHSPTLDSEACLGLPANDYGIRDVLFKYHAACYGTHSSMEGILQLKDEYGLSAEDIRRIILRVPSSLLNMCNILEPKTALEGKFSLRFTAALALAHDDTSEAAFTDVRVTQPEFVRLRDRVEVIGDHLVAGATEVTVETTDNRELRASIDVNRPERDLDRQWRRLEVKFRSLAEPVIGAGATDDVVHQVAHLDGIGNIGELVAMCESRSSLGGTR